MAVLNSSQLCDERSFSKERFLDQLAKFRIENLNGQTLLAEAFEKARQEDKRVLIQESATWCGPCHRLNQLLDENRQWEQDYVWVRMDHRWTEAQSIMKTIRDRAEGGVPWFAILDTDGKVLATSIHADTGYNIGFPSAESGRTHFANMLKATCNHMSDQEIQDLVNAATSQK